MDSYTLYLALYLVGFAALHSLLASLPVKSIARKRFGSRVDPWYPVFFSATAAVTLLPLVALIIYRPGRLLYILPSPWIWIFFALQLLIGLASLKAFSGCAAPLPDPGSTGRARQPSGICFGDKGDLLLDSGSLSSLRFSSPLADPLYDREHAASLPSGHGLSLPGLYALGEQARPPVRGGVCGL